MYSAAGVVKEVGAECCRRGEGGRSRGDVGCCRRGEGGRSRGCGGGSVIGGRKRGRVGWSTTHHYCN